MALTAGALAVSLAVVPPGWAFLYQIPILDKSAIIQLTDEVLLNTYIDVLVEMEASQMFHQTSGFTPQQYQKHKDLLKYKIFLFEEIQRRKLDVPGSLKVISPPEPKEAGSSAAAPAAPTQTQPNSTILIKE